MFVCGAMAGECAGMTTGGVVGARIAWASWNGGSALGVVTSRNAPLDRGERSHSSFRLDSAALVLDAVRTRPVCP